MLKMKEMSTSVSEVFSFMEFRHGPMSVITEESLVIGLITDARKREELKVLADMKALGATTMALIEDREIRRLILRSHSNPVYLNSPGVCCICLCYSFWGTIMLLVKGSIRTNPRI